MGKILITGGAGYIGSHVNKLLHGQGRETVVLDSLVTGHRDFAKWGDFVQGDLCDTALLADLFKRFEIDAVMHFAAFIAVGESVEKPREYYGNNVRNTLNLLEAMQDGGCSRIVFSSTAAVYGEPEQDKIDETHRFSPLSPYAWSKRMVEQVLEDFGAAYGTQSMRLRYFNAAGADPDGEIGERHIPETHLIPLIIHAALGLRKDIRIFGTDYPTPDGTCVRDYIHVQDLARAHLAALERMEQGHPGGAFNLGNGNGFSVREVIETVRRVTGRDFPVLEQERRPGDSPVLVASSEKAIRELGWKPRLDSLDEIVETAWRWHRKEAGKA